MKLKVRCEAEESLILHLEGRQPCAYSLREAFSRITFLEKLGVEVSYE